MNVIIKSPSKLLVYSPFEQKTEEKVVRVLQV